MRFLNDKENRGCSKVGSLPSIHLGDRQQNFARHFSLFPVHLDHDVCFYCYSHLNGFDDEPLETRERSTNRSVEEIEMMVMKCMNGKRRTYILPFDTNEHTSRRFVGNRTQEIRIWTNNGSVSLDSMTTGFIDWCGGERFELYKKIKAKNCYWWPDRSLILFLLAEWTDLSWSGIRSFERCFQQLHEGKFDENRREEGEEIG